VKKICLVEAGFVILLSGLTNGTKQGEPNLVMRDFWPAFFVDIVLVYVSIFKFAD